MYRRLRHEVHRTRGDLIRLVQELIRIPSPSLHEKDVARRIDSALRELQYDLVFTDDVGNVVGVNVGGDPSLTILMTSHLDTVSPQEIERWDRSPFSGDVVDGRIHGIGAADCKGGLASQVYAGHQLARCGLVDNGTIVLAATVAEENGYSIGIRHLMQTTLADLGLAPSFVLIGGPTALTIGSDHDGWVGIDVTVTGSSENPVRRVAERVVQELRRHTGTHEPPDSPPLMTVNDPRTVVAAEGFLVNVRLDRRLGAGESEDEALCWLEGALLEVGTKTDAVDIRVAVHEEERRLYTGHTRWARLSVPPWSANLESPLVERLHENMLEAGCRWTPRSRGRDRMGLGSAGAVVTREFGVPAIIYGPGSEREARESNESVAVDSLVESAYGTGVLLCGLSDHWPAMRSTGLSAGDDRFTARISGKRGPPVRAARTRTASMDGGTGRSR